MKYLLLLTFSILLFSCKTEIPEVEIISIDYRSSKEIKLSDFVKDFKIVRLETNDKCIVGQINKIQFYDNKIFILDQLSNSVFVFSKDGKFLNVLNKTGVGPGEYVAAFDLNVNNKGIFISDPGTHQILHYDFSFNFINNVRYPSVASFVFATESDNVFLYHEYGLNFYNQLIMMDENGKNINEFFPQDDTGYKKNWAASNIFQNRKDSLYFSPRYGNSIYKWDGQNWQEIIQLYFGNKTFTGNIRTIEDLYDDFPFIVREDYFMLNNYLFVSYLISDKYYYCFYNFGTKETVSGKIYNDLIPNYKVFGIAACSENVLIDVVYPGIMKEYPEFEGLNNIESLKDVTDDDNPILIMYEFK